MRRFPGTKALVLFVALATVAMVMGPSGAWADQGAAGSPPTIVSDKSDYAPGALVTLTGANWGPGESVHINVNDDQGKTWTRDVDVVAAEDGTIVDQFNLPDWFVATYQVTATGEESGAATTSFTDGNVQADTSGPTVTLQYQRFSANNCAGSPLASGSSSINPSSGSTILFGQSSGSFRLSVPSAVGSETFSHWTSQSNFSSPSNPLCFNAISGNRTFTANYSAPANSAPVIASNDSTVTVDEGQTAANSGTWSDANPGDTVTLSASVGTVTKSGTNASGTWSWSYPTSDGPDQSQTVTITADDGATSTSTTFTLTVNNVKPSITLTGPTTTTEGSTETYNFAVTDPGTDTHTFALSCGAAGTQVGTHTYDATTKTGSFQCRFPDGPASSTVTAGVTDSDGASDTDNRTVNVTVDNVAPTVDLSGDTSADEGQTKTYTYTITDPGDDDLAITEDCGANASYFPDGAANSFSCTFPDGPESSTVSVYAHDGDDIGSDAIDVAVANVAPSISLTGAATADEGDTKTYTYAVTDPGEDTHTVTTACGTGGTKSDDSFDQGSLTGGFKCTFPDGPATTDVTATVTDSDGASDSDNQIVTVTVSNVAPTVTLSGDANADEGEAKTYNFTVSDPGDDTFSLVPGFPICGTGGDLVADSLVTTATGGTFQCSFPDGPASPTAAIMVQDSDLAESNEATQTITVSNVKPSITLTGPASADEGTAATYEFAVSDPGAEDTHTFDLSCGSYGTQQGTEIYDPGTREGSFKCFFPDGPATTDVTAKATDDDGAGDTDDRRVTVIVANVAPVVTLTGSASAAEGATETYTYTVTDPGDDGADTTITEDCGADATYVPDGAANSFSCTFPDGPATSTVSVYVHDGDDIGSDAIEVTVANVAPTITSFTITGTGGVACVTNQVTVSFTVDDPASEGRDPIIGTIDWGDGSSTAISGRTVSESHTYAAGTYNLVAMVNDADGGSDSAGGTKNVSLLYATSGILQPINTTGQRSGFKIGSTIPVKVKITDCDGNPVTTLGPQVSLFKIDNNAEVPVNEVVSTSAADTGTTMRYSAGDSQYIYNLSTKRSQFCPGTSCSGGDLTQGSYRVKITHPTITAVQAEFDLRK